MNVLTIIIVSILLIYIIVVVILCQKTQKMLIRNYGKCTQYSRGEQHTLFRDLWNSARFCTSQGIYSMGRRHPEHDNNSVI